MFCHLTTIKILNIKKIIIRRAVKCWTRKSRVYLFFLRREYFEKIKEKWKAAGYKFIASCSMDFEIQCVYDIWHHVSIV